MAVDTRPNLLTRLRYAFAGVSLKAAYLPFVSAWVRESFLEPTFNRLTNEGYAANAAVFSCIAALSFAYPEPPLTVYQQDDEPIPNHPLQKLLRKPNPIMSEAELALYVISYLAIGGNCYLHKVRGQGGQVVELWPYHAGHMMPVPSRNAWVDAYKYDLGDGKSENVPAEDVVHLKWPSVDPHQPWMALPPLRAVAREVDTDSEATRYVYALLANDATPRTAIQVPPGVSLTSDQFERLRQQWQLRHGGANRGNVAVLEGGASISRLSLNLEELAFDTLRRVPEARIAAAFRVPAMIAGLNVGLERSTYSNFAEARQMFTENTLFPLWRMVADEIEQDLGDEFGGGVILRHDTSRVAALQENEDALYTRVVNAWEAGLLGRKEARRKLGLADEIEPDDEMHTPAAPAPEPSIMIEREEPRQLPAPKSKKAKAVRIESVEAAIARAVEEYLAGQYQLAANYVRSNA